MFFPASPFFFSFFFISVFFFVLHLSRLFFISRHPSIPQVAGRRLHLRRGTRLKPPCPPQNSPPLDSLSPTRRERASSRRLNGYNDSPSSERSSVKDPAAASFGICFRAAYLQKWAKLSMFSCLAVDFTKSNSRPGGSFPHYSDVAFSTAFLQGPLSTVGSWF